MLVSSAFGNSSTDNNDPDRTPYRSLRERRLIAEAAAASHRQSLRDKRKLRILGLLGCITFLSLYTSFDMVTQHDSTKRFLEKAGLMLPGLTDGKNYIKGTPFEKLRDVKDTQHYPNDIPLFFLVPKSATSTLKSILGHCLHLNQASSSSAIKYEKSSDVKELELVPINDGQGGSFLNVNFAWPDGIQRAAELGLASSGLVDVVVTSYIYEAADLYDEERKGRLFTVLRHPIKRMVSDYYYMQNAEWENLYDKEKDRPQSLMEYASNPKYHLDNFLTRFLSGNRSSKVTLQDYELAKEVLEKKTLILLQSKMEESVDRLLSYFDWNDEFISQHDDITITQAEKCVDGYLDKPVNVNKEPYEEPEPGSDEWEALRLISDWDIHLYWYGMELWEKQGKTLFRGKSNANGFREDGTSSRCAVDSKSSSSPPDGCKPIGEEDEELQQEEQLYLSELGEAEAEWYAKKKKQERQVYQNYSKKIDSVFEEEDKKIEKKKQNVALSMIQASSPKDTKAKNKGNGEPPEPVVEFVSLKGDTKSWLSLWS